MRPSTTEDGVEARKKADEQRVEMILLIRQIIIYDISRIFSLAQQKTLSLINYKPNLNACHAYLF